MSEIPKLPEPPPQGSKVSTYACYWAEYSTVLEARLRVALKDYESDIALLPISFQKARLDRIAALREGL